MGKSRAMFDYEFLGDGNVLCIEDMGVNHAAMSVTDDMEAVLEEIEEAEGPLGGKKIIYRDSEGMWDQVVGWPGQIRFVPLRATSKLVALALLREGG